MWFVKASSEMTAMNIRDAQMAENALWIRSQAKLINSKGRVMIWSHNGHLIHSPQVWQPLAWPITWQPAGVMIKEALGDKV
jgi:erythromycin esterase-like protein